jgi:hypothetical protein
LIVDASMASLKVMRTGAVTTTGLPAAATPPTVGPVVSPTMAGRISI